MTTMPSSRSSIAASRPPQQLAVQPGTVDAARRRLFRLDIDAVTLEQAVTRCRDAIRSRRSLLVGVVNAAKIVNLRHDPMLRDSVLESDLLLADGQSVVWASRMLGQPLPERVTGIDLFTSLLDLGHAEGRSVYLLGAKPEVLDQVVAVLHERWPGVVVAGARDGYFSDQESGDIAADIAAAQPDMLFLGITSPKKEIFLGRYAATLDVPVMHGVGGSFDIVAGVTHRAPLAWQRLGMEWAYRLQQEPGRLWLRYLHTNTAFIALLLRNLIRAEPGYPTVRPEPASERPGGRHG